MSKRKICVVVTARPSYSRIKTALLAIREHPELELQLVAAASSLLDRYGKAINVMKKDGFEVSASVCNVLEGEDLRSMSKTTGLGIIELSTVFDTLKPDMVVTVADRYETMSTAIAAAYMNIPLCHVQGGEITGSIDEKVRHSITKLADLHLVSTPKAKERVIRLGENPEMVHVTGCPSIDLAAEIMEKSALDFDPMEKYGGVGVPLDCADGYLVVMQHPVTTEYEASRSHVTETLHAIHAMGLPAFWFWPNVDAGSDGTSKGIRAFREQENPEHFHFFKNMEPHDFLRLLYNSRAIIGNSSVALRECSFMGVPAINIGSRQAGRERGENVQDVAYDRVQIESAIRHLLTQKRPPCDSLYGDGLAGRRIADILSTAPLVIDKKLEY